MENKQKEGGKKRQTHVQMAPEIHVVFVFSIRGKAAAPIAAPAPAGPQVLRAADLEDGGARGDAAEAHLGSRCRCRGRVWSL